MWNMVRSDFRVFYSQRNSMKSHFSIFSAFLLMIVYIMDIVWEPYTFLLNMHIFGYSVASGLLLYEPVGVLLCACAYRAPYSCMMAASKNVFSLRIARRCL